MLPAKVGELTPVYGKSLRSADIKSPNDINDIN